MAWGVTRNKPYDADYNRAFNTHTSGSTEADAAVNGPVYTEAPPGGFNIGAAYKNPATAAPPLDNRDTIGPREIATGNAPSGGYSTLPGLGYANSDLEGLDRGKRRYLMEDWEIGQEAIHAKRDEDTRERRRNALVIEDMATPKPVPGSEAVHNVTHSPYDREWPEPDRLTTRKNPNPWMFWRDWDNQGGTYRGSGARYLNGEHYSMAEHNSLHPFEAQEDGMAPVRQRRNTYRLDPPPWDTRVTDSPSNTPSYDMALDRTADDTQAGFPSNYRLY